MQFRHCPACARDLPDAAPGQPQRCGGCGRTWWKNSKPCVGAVILREGKVLLSRRAAEPHAGRWDLPGGFLEWGEEPLDGLAREVTEETGLTLVTALPLDAAVGRYGEERTLNLLYVCEATGDPKAGDDSAELRWFALGDLPDMAFAHERRALGIVAGGR